MRRRFCISGSEVGEALERCGDAVVLAVSRAGGRSQDSKQDPNAEQGEEGAEIAELRAGFAGLLRMITLTWAPAGGGDPDDRRDPGRNALRAKHISFLFRDIRAFFGFLRVRILPACRRSSARVAPGRPNPPNDLISQRHATPAAVPSGAACFRRPACAALASLLIYAVLFGAVLDRPLEFGFLAHELDAKLARAATIHGPKLVILAGSNGPYSHRCQVIEPMLDLPCVNGGVAVGIGLDYLFIRWEKQLHAGDVVYLPMERQQYIVRRLAASLGPDAAIMFRHDWTTLGELAPRRWLTAMFSFDLRAAMMSLIEMALVAVRFHDPRAADTGTNNAWGDHVGHTVARGETGPAVLAAMLGPPVAAASIRHGYGASQIAGFVTWARAHGVRVIGGLPTEFARTTPAPIAQRAAALAAIEAVYLARGGEFLVLPGASRYPATAFFDTPLHLNEPCQIAYSVRLARALAPLLGRAARPAPQLPRAQACPALERDD
jgi:hypothetical protein